MFVTRRFCRRCAVQYSHIRTGCCEKRVAESEPKSDEESAKISLKKSSRYYDDSRDDCRKNRSVINVGIIGGGMSPVYASLLLKQSRFIKSINIADPNDELAGAVYDLSHIDTSTRIKHYGKSCFNEALKNVDIIALMDEKDFEMGNAGPMEQLAAASNYVCKMSKFMVESCPSALVAVFARPVTATLPMCSEIYKICGRWDPNRIIGSNAINVMRIESMAASLFDLNPSYLSVPIVGGADPCTVVPLLTQAKPVNHFSPEHETTLIHQLKSADKALMNSVNRYKGPSLSSGAAAAKFITSLAAALVGCPNVTCSAYVRSDVLPLCRFFSNELRFGADGIEKNYGLPKISSQALDLIEQSLPHINELSKIAIENARNNNAV